jgi:acetyl-CoA carboxylase carboxyl transferase subunit alpha
MEFKVINGIIEEPTGGAHTNPDETAKRIKEVLVSELDNLCKRNPMALVRYRNQKILKLGHWNENN